MMTRTVGLRAALAAALILAQAPAQAKYKVSVRGGDEASFVPAAGTGAAAYDPVVYDAVVIGGGLAGLTAALYLADHGKTSLVLEKEEDLGGLAYGGSLKNGRGFNRGAAYWTGAYDEELKILERIGMGDYRKLHAIPEPIDSYLWKGKLHVGLWEEATLRELPASFELFKHELRLADKAKMIPNQPIEESGALGLDWMTGAEWIRRMPATTRLREDAESKAVYKRFLEDPSLDRADPMKDVVEYMETFTPSALGATPDVLSAVAFANFYISEIETRFTTPVGTGEAADLLEAHLRKSGLVTIKTKAPAVRVVNGAEEAVVTYTHKGRPRRARGRYVVFAAQLKFAPKIIEGLAQADPEKTAVIGGLDYAHFSVHAVFVKGHPYRASFDTWVRTADYAPGDFTDVILGRWMDPDIRAYEDFRDFKRHPADDQGVMTIYHPLAPGEVGKGYSTERARAIAEGAVDRMVARFSPLLKDTWGTTIDVRSVETNRWPYSIHIAKPGHFTVAAKVLRRPVGRVFFANNNIGTPAFEEALFRGHCAANNIVKRLDPAFAQEPWTRCPLEP